MEKLSKHLLSRMQQELQAIAMQSDNPLQLAERSFYLAETTVRELRENVVSKNFQGKEQEIWFFKEMKPMFQKELIYYQELFHFEAERPIAGKKALETHLSKLLNRIQCYFDKNRFLYNYYQLGSEEYDNQFFLREGGRLPLLPITTTDTDMDFSTPYSSKLAKLLAYKQLQNYLERFIGSQAPIDFPQAADEKDKIFWTDKKADAMELILCIHASGSINFGNISLKRLVSIFERVFNIKLDNYSQISKNIRMRKKDRTSYMHHAIERGEKKMDDTDMDF